MAFEVEYFHERVLAEIESWPVDVLADYARLVELLVEHGPSLRLPHSRGRSVMVCSSFARAAGQALAGPSTAFWWANAWSCCMHSSRRASKRRTEN
jgi:hypothetical protein